MPYSLSFPDQPDGVPTPAATARLLLVDDEPRLLDSLAELLKSRGFELVCVTSGQDALLQLASNSFDLVVLDLDLGSADIDGHGVMDFINAQRLDADVVVTSGANSIDAAIGALKRGAHDYLRKPYAREELLKTVDNALQHRRLQQENKRIAAQLASSERSYRYLVDSSPDIIYTLDDAGHFTFINNRAQQLLGFSRDDLIGQHYSVLVFEDDLERAHYVFNEGRSDYRLSRNVELRLKSRQNDAEARTFNHELILIAARNPPRPANRSRVLGIYGVARDITDRKRADELIAHQAYHDILTDLPNRVLFKDRLGLALLQAKRNESRLAVMFIDLDRFKLVNDTLGHVMGDELLQQTAARLKGCLRRCDTLARLGGDEFTAVLPELASQEDAARIAEKFLDCLKPAFVLAGQPVYISASIGIAVYPEDGKLIDDLLRNSDIAMYHAKGAGKNAHAFFNASMLDASSQKIALQHSLHEALARGELEMYYQPQVDAATGKIVGAEALMRWNHPQRGLLSAGEFLPFAEENGLMIPISDWMLGAICCDLLAWNATGCDALRLSLNLSPQYLDRGDFFDKLQHALTSHNIAPAQIEVEVTENICIRNPQTAIEQLDKLCQLGVSVAIDDFGTGYSSLSYLHRFPIHTLKIDRSFVMQIQDDTAQFPVVLAIISIAKGLGLNLVAEGVETAMQVSYLTQSGCSTMQGYYYHRPLSHTRLLELLHSQRNLFQDQSARTAA